MSLRVFVPGDAGAIALGSNQVAEALVAAAGRRGLELEVVRNGSRGLYWLEPMMEIATSSGRLAYGPVTPEAAEPVLDAALSQPDRHALYLGVPEEIPYLKRQTRLTFARCGIVNPRSLDDYRAHDGYKALVRALRMGPAAVVEEVTQSGLRGRGGAGFPTGIKWKTVAEAVGEQKYIVCNADEGDSGTFADRMIMEGDPFVSDRRDDDRRHRRRRDAGLYLCPRPNTRTPLPCSSRRSAARRRGQARRQRRGFGGKSFDLEVRVGAGAYMCGEETALLESLEGKRGEVRAKPPLPATRACSVIRPSSTMCSLRLGADHPRPRARRSIEISAWASRAGRCRSSSPATSSTRGSIETAFGVTLARDLSTISAGGPAPGARSGRSRSAGPLGAYFPRALFEPLRLRGLRGRTVWSATAASWSSTIPWTWPSRPASPWSSALSNRCGKCTPCRIGSTRGIEVIDRIIRRREPRREYCIARGPLQDDEVWIALCPWRIDALSGDERA